MVKQGTSLFKYFVSGYELSPETQQMHWQVYGELWKQTRFSTLCKLFPKTNFRDKNGKLLIRRGSPTEARDYSLKDRGKDGFEEYEIGTLPEDKRKSKSRPTYSPFKREDLPDWNQPIIDMCEQDPDPRMVYWYWEPIGNVGKTRLARYLCSELGAIVLSGKAADCKMAVIQYIEKHNKRPPIVIMDVPRCHSAEYISYEAIESIKQMFFFNGKYEGGQVNEPPCHLIVFANEPPVTTKLSCDRWSIQEIKP